MNLLAVISGTIPQKSTVDRIGKGCSFQTWETKTHIVYRLLSLKATYVDCKLEMKMLNRGNQNVNVFANLLATGASRDIIQSMYDLGLKILTKVCLRRLANIYFLARYSASQQWFLFLRTSLIVRLGLEHPNEFWINGLALYLFVC